LPVPGEIALYRRPGYANRRYRHSTAASRVQPNSAVPDSSHADPERLTPPGTHGTMEVPEDLLAQVIEFVKTIPSGKVVSYGQIPSRLGVRDARLIGWAMHASGGVEGLPWWRVLNNEGRITIKDEAGRIKQRNLLAAEGIKVGEDFTLDIEAYRHGEVPGQKR